LTQSAVSQMIANLEESIGVQLFDRQVRPIALTPSGIILIEKARALLLAARDAINSAREPTASAFPRLNLCLVHTVAGTIGAALISQVKEYATLWSVHAGLHSQHNQSLLGRTADIVVSPDPLEHEAGLERHPVVKERFFLALPRSYTKEVDGLGRLAEDLDMVRFSSRTMLGRQIERHLRRLRIEVKGRVEFDNSDAVLAMVAGGLGWSLITPTCALLGRSFWPQLRFERMPDPALYRRLFVVARQGELGDIPVKIASNAIASLSETFNSKFLPEYSWAVKDCTIAEPPLKVQALKNGHLSGSTLTGC
ncbi:MAG TPA: LysR family transcriptional regulator, partial [Hyphomicrobiales bacterium]|nr:LysR family transcriptional regulator [Hyphomicrobiales bacterium]